ncbi:leucine-rich repeat domain-containing protein [Fulvivirga sediminis]|uniref:Leucine-rich repeat domain-containing protein n=1 Tax=Fulvivirga sediminis TaxID=2803949 RepID=A0A937JZH1_9BACT|nr:leucine-rich repeat domain-containing protein [Fulvivirga sediminis]MBL3657398.1 leucine-rich repeat domain-containing protein [Fulvivirga sediminis]
MDYEKAAFDYEEASLYPSRKDRFEALIYYKIYSTYFLGNKKSAFWQAGFLENYGIKRDTVLMKAISEEKLDIKDYEGVPLFSIDIEEIRKEIQIQLQLEYSMVYIPAYSKELYYEPRHKVDDLAGLDKSIELLNLSSANITELPDDILGFTNLRALDLSRNKITDFDKLFKLLSHLPSLEYLELDLSNLKYIPPSLYN